jgi:hypothetical protein
MSAVLPTPTPFTLVNTEELKAYIQSEIKKGIEKALPAAVKEVLSDPENPILIRAIDNILVFSEHRILKRLTDTEKVTGIYKFEEFEEHEPTIPEQITKLKKTTGYAQKPIDTVKPEPLISPKTSAEKKAVAFAEWLFKKPHSPTGIIQADDKEIKDFINSELPEKLRGKDRSERKIKMRIINKAKELYPNIIDTHKSDNGRHETSVFVKGSYQSNRTVRTSLMLAGELL